LKTLFIVILLISGIIYGCVSWFRPTISFDSRSLSIQTLSLFDQRETVPGKVSWAGDWIMRRERLDLIDQELRNEKPDILIFQSMMSRKGSPSESDRLILQAGSLRGYEATVDTVSQFDDTLEEESMAIFASSPLRIDPSSSEKRQLWGIGADGYLSATVLRTEDDPVVVFNVQMPSRIGRKFLWYTFIHQRISEFLQAGGFCRERIIVAGYLPADQGAVRFQTFLQDLELKDTSLGFCTIANTCFTGTPSNELFVVTNPDEPGAQLDRILVNAKSSVLAAGRNITASQPSSAYFKRYGLSRVWAVQRFGWRATVRLPKCSKSITANE
jgi:hypothetical protein